MFCEYCGAASARARCPQCHKHSSAFWFTVLSGLFLLVTIAAFYAYYAYLFPVIVALATSMRIELVSPARFAYPLGRYFTEVWFLVVLALLVVSLGISVRKGKLMLGRAGETVGAIALVLLLVFLMGAGGGDVWMLIELPSTVREARIYRNQTIALETVDDINLLQHQLAAANPATGFSCSLDDLIQRTSRLDLSIPAKRLRDRTQLGPSVFGYDVRITACSGPKPGSYRIAAIPDQYGFGGIASYCADPAGVVKKGYISSDSLAAREAFIKACQ